MQVASFVEAGVKVHGSEVNFALALITKTNNHYQWSHYISNFNISKVKINPIEILEKNESATSYMDNRAFELLK